LKKKLKQLETARTTGDETLAHDYSEKLHELEIWAATYIHQKQKKYCKAWLLNESLQKPYKLFSGGWRMRYS
jgi:ATP-binding cassette subfamily F protein 3